MAAVTILRRALPPASQVTRIVIEPGFKNPKFVTAIDVTNERPRGDGADRVSNRFGGN